MRSEPASEAGTRCPQCDRLISEKSQNLVDDDGCLFCLVSENDE